MRPFRAGEKVRVFQLSAQSEGEVGMIGTIEKVEAYYKTPGASPVLCAWIDGKRVRIKDLVRV